MDDAPYPRPFELRGDRILLVPLTEQDLDDVRRWRSDPEVTRFWITQAVPSALEIYGWYEQNRQGGSLSWIIRSEEDASIGFINLFDLDPRRRKAEVALMIGERRLWGRGYAREALRTLLRFAFMSRPVGLDLHKVYLTVFVENIAARRAYAACGFREDGVLRDDVYRDGVWYDQILMSVLESEFIALEDGAAPNGA